jgi:hypothetical protein
VVGVIGVSAPAGCTGLGVHALPLAAGAVAASPDVVIGTAVHALESGSVLVRSAQALVL